ncbi:MAG: UDP-3-O-(3-hydroxymyristoyl)glucosamine N-acyltransferase [Paracoccaceae bacterium]
MLTLKDISSRIGGAIEGNPKIMLSGPSEPKSANETQLALALNDQYISDIYLGKAKAALFTKSVDWRKYKLEGAIFLNKGKSALYKVNKLFHYPPKVLKGVSPSAIVDETAKIGKNVNIGPFTYVGANCVIGDNVNIFSNVTIMNNVTIDNATVLYSGVRVFENVKIGKNVICSANVVIGSDGFSFVSDTGDGIEKAMLTRSDEVKMNLNNYLKVESLGSVDIHSNVEIGANCCIDKGTISNTIIGEGTKIDNLVHIAHNVHLGKNCLICGQVGIAGSAKIGDRVVMGGQSGVGDNIEVGSDVILAGKTGLSVNAKPNQFLMGNPAMLKSRNIKSYMAFRRLPQLIKMLKK